MEEDWGQNLERMRELKTIRLTRLYQGGESGFKKQRLGGSKKKERENRVIRNCWKQKDNSSETNIIGNAYGVGEEGEENRVCQRKELRSRKDGPEHEGVYRRLLELNAINQENEPVVLQLQETEPVIVRTWQARASSGLRTKCKIRRKKKPSKGNRSLNP